MKMLSLEEFRGYLKNADASQGKVLTSLRDVQRRVDQSKPWRIYLSFIGGKSAKFWEAYSTDSQVVSIHWGRIGSKGQVITKGLDYFKKASREKLKKGYQFSNPRDAMRSLKPKGLTPEYAQAMATYVSLVLLAAEKWYLGPIEGLSSRVSDLVAFGEVAGVPVADLVAFYPQVHQSYLKQMRGFLVAWKNPLVKKYKLRIPGGKLASIGDALRWMVPRVSPPEKTLPPPTQAQKLAEKVRELYAPSEVSGKIWQYLYESSDIPEHIDTLVRQIADGKVGTATDQKAAQLLTHTLADGTNRNYSKNWTNQAMAASKWNDFAKKLQKRLADYGYD